MKLLFVVFCSIACALSVRASASDCNGEPWSYKQIMEIYKLPPDADSPMPFLGYWVAVRVIVDDSKALESKKYYDCDGLRNARGMIYLSLRLILDKDSFQIIPIYGDRGMPPLKPNFRDGMMNFKLLQGGLDVSYQCKTVDGALFCMQIDNANGVKGGYNQGYEFQHFCTEPPGRMKGGCN